MYMYLNLKVNDKWLKHEIYSQDMDDRHTKG